MKVLYICPRYHTNQIPVVRGWQERGDEVAFLVRARGPIEDYSELEPVMAEYAPSALFLVRVWCMLHPHDPAAPDLILKIGYPKKKKVADFLRSFRPELVILRERSIYSIVCYRLIRRILPETRVLLYNQSPLQSIADNTRTDAPHRLMDRLLPLPRITPVRGTGSFTERDSYFVPFVAIPQCAPDERAYCEDGRVRILSIGRFEERKNHLLLLDVFAKLRAACPAVVLTIVGECKDSFQKEYLTRVEKRIEELKLSEAVTVRLNLDRNAMDVVYRQTDLYVLPSTGEPAAVSILEAMSYSIPAVSSDGNGTADYIEPGVSGDIFHDRDADDLYRALEAIVRDKETIIRLGAGARRAIEEKYTFPRYYEALMSVVTGR